MGLVGEEALSLEAPLGPSGLCIGVNLLGCFAAPLRCFSVILRYAFAIVAHMAKPELRVGISLPGKFLAEALP